MQVQMQVLVQVQVQILPLGRVDINDQLRVRSILVTSEDLVWVWSGSGAPGPHLHVLLKVANIAYTSNYSGDLIPFSIGSVFEAAFSEVNSWF